MVLTCTWRDLWHAAQARGPQPKVGALPRDPGIWNGVNSKAARRVPQQLWPAVRRKLDQIDAVIRLDDLKIPPGNRLHALVGNLAGYHAVRVNDQYRVVFRFDGHDAHDIRCTDYH